MKRADALDLLARCQDALSAAGEAEAEVWARTRERGCARFSVGELAQHMGFEEAEARVRVASGGRIAEVTTSDLTHTSLVSAIADASHLAHRAPALEGFDGFADGGLPMPDIDRWSDATAQTTDEERAEIASSILSRIRREGLVAAGMVETGAHAVAVATTRGCARAHAGTLAEVRAWALADAAGKGASGHGSHLCRDVSRLEVEREAEDAIRISKDASAPGRVDAGTWDVVMEPPAVAELLEWLAMIGMSAPELEQGTSFMADRIGQPVTGALVNITEDPLSTHEGAIADPFDREGVARARVPIVERGIARAVLYDRVHASRASTVSTGSALVPDFGSPGGVGVVGLALDGGDAPSASSLIEGMDRGLYVRRLNYVNGFIEPRRAVMTGLSRDGCFLVEKGRVVRAVGNVRMTDSFLEMLARADGMTRERRAVSAAWTTGAAFLVPAVRFRAVRITSGSRDA